MMELSLLCWMLILCILGLIQAFTTLPSIVHTATGRRSRSYRLMTPPNPIESDIAVTDKKKNGGKKHIMEAIIPHSANKRNYLGIEGWEGSMEGFDWQLEQARRVLEGPSFAPIRTTLWSPILNDSKLKKVPPGFFDSSKILINNAFQIMGLAESMDGAPLVQGVNTFKGSPLKLLSRILDGNLQELAGRPLFLLLHDYYVKYGPIYKLAFGPKSFMVVSDPVMVKHILKDNPNNYDKGILAEILEPIMGKGLIPADVETWKVRRKAVVPGFHKAWLNAMMGLFVQCNKPLIDKLEICAETGATLDMEVEFGSVSLDIIGRAVFNYDFGSVNQESPVVKAVYRALQEAEYRSTSFIPYWDLPFANYFMPNLQDFEKNMKLLNDVLDELIAKAIETQKEEDVEELETRDYSTMENPSLLRFLVDMRGEESTSVQLRDDLMTMLIAGHETTAAVLTWTFFELCQQPDLMARVQKEVDDVLQGTDPKSEDMSNLPLLRLCLAETLRMYPEPPLLIRRALEDDVLPKGGAKSKTFIPKGTDIFMATWNIHRSEDFWVEPLRYNPDRFMQNHTNPNQPEWAGYKAGSNKQLYPNEVTSNFAFLPFGGGSRKCVGDQFAMMEAISTVALILQRFDLSLSTPAEHVGMRTGATIHTENGLVLSAKKRTVFSTPHTPRTTQAPSHISHASHAHGVKVEDDAIIYEGKHTENTEKHAEKHYSARHKVDVNICTHHHSSTSTPSSTSSSSSSSSPSSTSTSSSSSSSPHIPTHPTHTHIPALISSLTSHTPSHVPHPSHSSSSALAAHPATTDGEIDTDIHTPHTPHATHSTHPTQSTHTTHTEEHTHHTHHTPTENTIPHQIDHSNHVDSHENHNKNENIQTKTDPKGQSSGSKCPMHFN